MVVPAEQGIQPLVTLGKTAVVPMVVPAVLGGVSGRTVATGKTVATELTGLMEAVSRLQSEQSRDPIGKLPVALRDSVEIRVVAAVVAVVVEDNLTMAVVVEVAVVVAVKVGALAAAVRVVARRSRFW
jgi:hypothetical protein